MHPLLTELATEARRLAGLGLMACTGGNLSVRLPEAPARVAVSASGLDKGALRGEDFILVGEDGRPLDGDRRKPSDETVLHLAIYRATGCACVCHGHPPHAVALSLAPGPSIRTAGIEMQKAFAGTRTHACVRALPIIDNSQDMGELSARALAAIDPDVPAVVVRGHGVYAWGRSVSEAGRHLETVEWLCHVAWLARTAGIPLPEHSAG
jgi:methylthioribulose-1-phosphate dehydratase